MEAEQEEEAPAALLCVGPATPIPASTSLGQPLDWLLPAAGERPVPG